MAIDKATLEKEQKVVNESMKALILFHAGVGQILQVIAEMKAENEAGITLDTLKGAIGAMAEGHIETTAAMKAAVENSGLLKPPKGELLN
jgi:hypothetical protein